MPGLDALHGHLDRSPPDAVVARYAAAQHGVVATADLRAAGLTAPMVRRRVAAGRLHRVFRGVYAVGHPRLTADGRRYAAVRACGPRAVASHLTAAALWDLRHSARLEVTVPGKRTGPREVAVHETRRLEPADTTTIDGIPVTSLARTIVDLAEVLPPDRLERIIDRAGRLDGFDLHELRATASRLSGRRGLPTLAAALAMPSPGLTRSELEDAFLALCRAARLPLPQTNAHVAAGGTLYEADALFAAHRLIVELDGAGTHDTTTAFHADRRRDAALAAAGFQTLRYTDIRLRREARAVAAELRAVLSARRR